MTRSFVSRLGLAWNRPGILATLFATLIATVQLPPALADNCGDRLLRIGLDIGHSQSTPGAESATGQAEFTFNDRFARELLQMSRSRPRLKMFLLTTKGESLTLTQRPQLARTLGADVFLSVHHDSVNRRYLKPWLHEGRQRWHTDAFKGYSLFVSSDNVAFKESLRLAELLGRRLKGSGFQQTLHHAEPIPGEGRQLLSWELGVYSAPFVVLRAARTPAVLVELGVIAHKYEEQLLNLPEYRERMAKSILDGLEDFCSG